ncbi:MAG: preprotein translocase subunit SecY [Candidatus Aenigmarchaeota archaeon]|nr:preprotein translocase subunit SecY [Candidatus Aenigmarchaeota archaeon]
MGFYDKLVSSLPGIAEPKGHLSFKSRLKWTAAALLLFLVMGQITLYGVAPAALGRFQFFEMILGSSIGSLVTLGIGPIVTASIILQLLVGSKIIPWDLKTPEGKKRFQGTQKLMAIFFCIFEAVAFVSFGAVQPVNAEATTFALLVLQLAFGAFLLLLLDEVVSKWGIGSGISLFIAAGVAKTIFVGMFNPCVPLTDEVTGRVVCGAPDASRGSFSAGRIPQFVEYLQIGDTYLAFTSLLPVIATMVVFAIVVYAQALKVEIPLAFGALRGFSRRWPLKLIYTSNIPVILMAALLANIQLVGNLSARPTEEATRCGFLGCFDEQGSPVGGLVYYLTIPQSLSIQVLFLVWLLVVFAAGFMAFYLRYKSPPKVILASLLAGFVIALAATSAFVSLPTSTEILRVLVYFFVLVTGATIFSIFWISTSGMDAKSVAEQIEGMGMQVPGFRRDPRIVEQVLERYIPTLSIISGVFIGTLAAVADFTQAIGSGTGILLSVMIIYNFYEQISMRYMEDMHPALRKFFG